MDFQPIAIVFIAIFGFSNGFEHGVQYEYEYETKVLSSSDKPFGFQFAASTFITTVWKSPENEANELIKIKLSSPQLSVFKKSLDFQKSNLDNQKQMELYVHRENNRVVSVYSVIDGNGYLKNIVRGIGSFLEFHQTSEVVEEIGLSGVCSAAYTLIGNILTKTIDQCNQLNLNNECVRCARIIRSSQAQYELQNEHVFSTIEATDTITMHSNLIESVKLSIESITTMKLKNTAPNQSIIDASNIENALESLKAQHNGKIEKGKLSDLHFAEPKITNLIKSVQKYLKHLKAKQLAKVPSASAFLKLLKHFRQSSEEQIKEVLKNKEFKSILPQLLDIVAFAGTNASLMAVLGTLDLSKGNSDNIERYLLSLSLTQHVSSESLIRISKAIESEDVNDKVKASLITTLGALVRTYSDNIGRKNDEIVQEMLDFLQKFFSSCTDDSCKLTYLRAIRNAALPRTTSFLKNYVEEGGQHSLEALRALKNIGFHDSFSDCVSFNEKVYYSVKWKYDTSSRIAAAEMLLNCYSNLTVLSRLLSSLEDQSENEVSTFISAKIWEKMNENQNFRSDVLNIVSNRDIKSYLTFSHAGTSTTFEKQLFSTQSLNGTYGISMEMLPGGLLRRSSFDINVQKPNENLHILSVGIFADGLGSFASGSSDNNDEGGVDPTAGMELTLLGVSIRPYIFFVGTSELMKHAFAGTASDPLPALQGNFLLVNSHEVVTLQNGFNVKFDLQSALSINLEASMQISLWYRTSKSKVKNGIALYTNGVASIETDFVSVENGFTLKGQTNMDFISDLEFAEPPFRMCMQMTRPEFPLKMTDTKELSILGTSFVVKRDKKTTWTVPPTSYAFHQKNNKLCTIMLNSNY